MVPGGHYEPVTAVRELIGWVRTLDGAFWLRWDYRIAFEEWRHHMAARRTDASVMAATKPPAGALVKFWRKHRTTTKAPPALIEA